MRFPSFRLIWLLFRKELRSTFDTPTAYIVLLVFVLLWEFLFLQNAFLVGEASMRAFFDLLPWLALLLAPALTMRSISQEREEGTVEFVLTRPVRPSEFVLAKWLSGLAFVSLILLLTLPLPLSLGQYGNFDRGIVFTQYLASLFLFEVLLALGILLSSRFKSAVSALLTAAVASFLLVVIGSDIVTAGLPLWLTAIFERLSISTHYSAMARGVLDLRDVLYFLAATVTFLALAIFQVTQINRPPRNRQTRQQSITVWLIVGITVLIAILGSRIPGRLDLTEDRLYTLSLATREIAGSLPDIVQITLYASKELPTQFKPRARDVADILQDYETAGRGNVVVRVVDPADDPDAQNAAASAGIQPVQFNVVGNEEFQVKTGYFALAVSYGGQTETIPYIEQTGNFEYQVTGFLRKLTATEQKTIGMLSGYGAASTDISFLRSQLEEQYVVEDITLTEEESTIPDSVSVLLVAGLTEPLPEPVLTSVQSYLENGGAALVLADGVSVDLQTLAVSDNPQRLSVLLEPYGVTINADLVFDLISNESINFGGGFVGFVLPYPFWNRALVASDAAVTGSQETILLPWPSSLTATDPLPEGVTVTPLFTTSDVAGVQKGTYDLSPDQDLAAGTPEENLGTAQMVMQITKERAEGTPTRLIVAGDADFVTDEFVQQAPENIIFALNAVDWLSQETALASIRTKTITNRQLVFSADGQKSAIRVGNFLFIVLLSVGFGVFRLLRRRSRMKRTYA